MTDPEIEPAKSLDVDSPNFMRVKHRWLTGDINLPSVPNMRVEDYWRWAHSDILENIQRGIYAEFLVAAALGITGNIRVGWAPYDLEHEGYKIEVKSSAYLQSWPQREYSNISFGIGKTYFFNPEGQPESDPRHHADCYVFCKYCEKDPEAADVLDADKWIFYVVPISRLVKHCGIQKSVVENRIMQITTPVRYELLKDRIEATRRGEVFAGSEGSLSPDNTYEQIRKTYMYAVWQRGTRLNPVIVMAPNADEALVLGRADDVLASCGVAISCQRVSSGMLNELLERGAVDLRGL